MLVTKAMNTISFNSHYHAYEVTITEKIEIVTLDTVFEPSSIYRNLNPEDNRLFIRPMSYTYY